MRVAADADDGDERTVPQGFVHEPGATGRSESVKRETDTEVEEREAQRQRLLEERGDKRSMECHLDDDVQISAKPRLEKADAGADVDVQQPTIAAGSVSEPTIVLGRVEILTSSVGIKVFAAAAAAEMSDGGAAESLELEACGSSGADFRIVSAAIAALHVLE